MHVAEQLLSMQWDDLQLRLYAKTAKDVERALNKQHRSFEDFLALVSPTADHFLPAMAKQAQSITRQRFGNTVSMFVPLYLSNLCANECTYCGFTMSNKIKRKTLNHREIASEAKAIKKMGFDNVLLVTGEHETKVGLDYFCGVIPLLRQYFSYLMMEVQPFSEPAYRKLKALGVDGVLVYQETYNSGIYAKHHLRGQKQDFLWRLETPDRLGKAGMNKIGLGALLGLSDWRIDSAFTALHARLLQQHYVRSRFSIAFPRLRPCAGQPNINASHINQRQLLQLICAQRLFNPQAELSLSTRESAYFRDNAIPIAITSVSAGSQTQPGGYSEASAGALAQFETEDRRAPADVAATLTNRGLEPVWTDWLPGYSG